MLKNNSIYWMLIIEQNKGNNEKNLIKNIIFLIKKKINKEITLKLIFFSKLLKYKFLLFYKLFEN